MEGLHGGFYWIPDDRDVWTVGRFVTADAKFCKFIKPDGTETQKVGKLGAFEHVLADQLEGKPNICDVQRVTKASLLHTVRTRYYKDDVYTNVARIVIAVNPFRALPIYGSRFINQYEKDEPENLPPHVYGVAAEALRNIRQDNYKSQAILISGESGAGKTESTKLVLSFVTDALRSNESTEEEISIEEKVLMTSPVLEAFGNAKTARNNNSSRFGKWLEISFSKDYGLGLTRVSGARIKDYLLEDPRVTKIGSNERNYHIFYHLFHHYGEEFGLPEDFIYLRDGASIDDDTANCNKEDYSEMRRAMTSLGFSEQEQLQIFDVVAALLHIGNIQFIPSPALGSEGSVIEEGESLEEAARLLGVRPEVLERSMVERQILVGQERTIVFRSPAKAASAKDALARFIYGYLFKWLVHRMNMTLGMEGRPAPPPGQPSAFLGVLDIAGFESFEENSLEQLFINLSNEELQHYFNQRVFMQETIEYEKEDIPIGIFDFSAVDNSEVVQLIAGKNGLLPILDDEVGLPNSTTLSYISKVKKAQAKAKRFVPSKFSSSCNFRVVHFAGQVEYNADQWLEKNVDNPPMESLDLLQRSELHVIKGILAQVKRDAETDRRRVGNRAIIRKKTVATKFVRSLRALLAKVGTCTPHFIRCIKPNHMKKPQVFDAPMAMEQLNFSGVLEAIKIRQMGYPLRMAFGDFSLRYAGVVPLKTRSSLRKEFNSPKLDTLDAVTALLEAIRRVLGNTCSESDFAVGKERLFIKGPSLILLEENRRHVYAEAANKLTCWSRGTVLRLRLKRHLHLAEKIQQLVTMPQLPCASVDQVEVYQKELEQLLSEVPEKVSFVGFGQCPNFPMSLAIQKTLQAAKVLVRKLGNQIDMWKKLADSNWMVSFDVMEMTKMLVRANDLELSSHPPCLQLIKALEARAKQLKKELPLLHALELATDEKNEGLDQWQAVLHMVEDSGIVESSWLHANGYKMTEQLRDMVQQEIENETARRITVSSCGDIEVEGVHRVTQKREDFVYEAIDQHARELLLCELEKAIEYLDNSALETLLGDAMSMGLTSDKEFREATRIFEALQSEEYPLSVLREEIAMKNKKRTQQQVRRLLNLKDRLEQLGCDQEARQVAQLVQSGVMGTFGKNMAFDKIDESELALVAFEDIRNFPRILESKEKLRWSNEKITKPLTDIPQRLQRDAVWMFGDILGWMKDRRAEKATHQALAFDIVTVALKDQYLADEAYIQVIKQLTDNPSEWSEHWGWKLMLLLCIEITPGEDLVEFIRCVLRKRVIPAHFGIQKLCLNEINSRLRKRQTDFTGRECQIVVHLLNGESVKISGTFGTIVDIIKTEACRYFNLPSREYAVFSPGNYSLWRLLPDHEPIRSFIDQKLTLRQLSLYRAQLNDGLHGKLSLLQARNYLLFGSDDERIACKSPNDVPPRMKHRASVKQLNDVSEYGELQKNHWFGCLTWPAEVITPTEEEIMPMPDAAHITSFQMHLVWVAVNYEGVGFVPVGTSSQRDNNTWFTYEHVLRWGAKKDIFQIVIRTPNDKCVSLFVKSSMALEIAYGLTRVCTAMNEA